MTVTYVVVTLAAVLAAVVHKYFRLPDPNMDHNPLCQQFPYLLLAVTNNSIMLDDLPYGKPQHVLDEY